MVNDLHKSVTKILLLVFAALVGCLDSNASPSISTTGKSSSSLCFVENKGQIRDQFGADRTDANYRLAAKGMNIFIGSGHMHYQWQKQIPAKNNEIIYESYRLDVELVGANKDVIPLAEQATGFYENYYTDYLAGVKAHAYGRVIYKNIYNNIDWVLYVQDGGLKYDFIVHPGGNAKDIQIRYSGATDIADKNGDIIVKTPFGSVTENAPYSYLANTKEAVVSQYVLDGSTVSFQVAGNNETLIIDPSLEWATYMGDTMADYGMCAASDTAGNVYMGGRTEGPTATNIFTTGAHQDTFAGDYDGFITRYTAGGVRQWSTYYGGNKYDAIYSIAVDKENNIVFAGSTDGSTKGIASPTGFRKDYCGGTSDAFLVKMDITGVRLWGTYYGGAGSERYGNDYQAGVICDTNTNIYLVGITESDTGMVTSGTQQATRSGDYDGYIAKFNKSGTRIWGSYYGGANTDRFTNVSVDSNGTPYTIGYFKSGGMGTVNTHRPTKPSNDITFTDTSDIIIVKFNQYTGTRTWATYYGGANYEESRGIVVGDTNFVYICGTTGSDTGIATTGTSQATFGGSRDMFVAKFDSTGKRVWGTYFGGTATDNGGNIVIDHKGNLNVTGNTGSDNGIATSDAFRLVRNLGDNTSSAFDAMIAIYNNQGVKIWSTYYGGKGNDYGYGVARGKSYGHIYFAGNSESNTGISYNGAQMGHGGKNDAFMVKITPDTSVSIGKESVKAVYCEEDTFTMKYFTTERFRAGNVFTVQLSDATGSFTTPKNIGSAPSVGLDSGYIFVQLPPNTSGNKFRIRIVGTAPIDTSYDNEEDVLIKPLPIWPVASNNGPTCSNDTLRLYSSNSTPGSTYAWTGPSTYAASVQNATRVNMTALAHSGDYIVTATLNGCSRKDTTTVLIKQAAAKPDLTSNAPMCTREDLKLTVATTGSGFTVDWFKIAGAWTASGPGTKTISNVSTGDAGKYVVALKQNGCESKDTVDVVISEKPAQVYASKVTSTGTNVLCAHDTLYLYANSATPGVTYQWTMPNLVVNEQNPILTDLSSVNSGNIVVSATQNGCSTYDTIKNMTFKESPPKPDASSNAPLCSDQTLSLQASNIPGSANAKGEWRLLPGGSWFNVAPGGINYIASAQTSHAGFYELKSTNQTTGCYRTDTVEVDITQSWYYPNNKPLIDKGNAVCPTDTIELFMNPAPTGVTYSWSGPGTFVPNNNVARPKVEDVQFSDSGWYVVRITGAACSSSIDSVHLAVVDTLSPPVITLPLFDCIGDTMMIRGTHPYLSNKILEFPGGTSSMPGNTLILSNVSVAANQGRYILSVKSGGCLAADTGYLNDIRPTPAPPDVTASTPLCEDNTLNLSATSAVSGGSYNWSGPSGFSSVAQNPSISNVKRIFHFGYYKATVTQAGCTSKADSALVVINVNPIPVIISDDQFCEGDAISLSARDNPGETYQWTHSSGFSAEGANATVNMAKLSDGGPYTVTATTTATGCTGTAEVNVEIIPLPGMPDATYIEPLCEGDKMELSLTDTSTGPISYVWRGPNGFVFMEKNAFVNDVKLTDGGIYIVTASRRGCPITDTLDVRVRPRPAKPVLSSNSPVLSGEELMLMVDNPVTGATFRWTGPLGFTSLAQNPVLNGLNTNASGIYTLTTTLDGCNSSSQISVMVNKGAGKLDELILFPNPNNGTFTVRAKLSFDQIMPYEILNTLGMVIYSDLTESVDKQLEKTIELDSKLASGYYIFRIVVSGYTQEIPFAIVR